MNEKKIEELINKALREESSLPDGLSERLEQKIDLLAKKEMQADRTNNADKRFSFKRRLSYWVGGIAATMLGAVLFVFSETNRPETALTDTYTDPQEAAIVAQKALAMMSANLNKGLIKVNKTSEEIYKVNKIVNKQLNNE